VPISTLRHIIQHGDGSFSSFLSKGADGNQLDVIRLLETQVRDLSTKLDAMERKASVVGGKDSALGSTKTAEA
jgi:hypothetical protein